MNPVSLSVSEIWKLRWSWLNDSSESHMLLWFPLLSSQYLTCLFWLPCCHLTDVFTIPCHSQTLLALPDDPTNPQCSISGALGREADGGVVHSATLLGGRWRQLGLQQEVGLQGWAWRRHSKSPRTQGRTAHLEPALSGSRWQQLGATAALEQAMICVGQVTAFMDYHFLLTTSHLCVAALKPSSLINRVLLTCFFDSGQLLISPFSSPGWLPVPSWVSALSRSVQSLVKGGSDIHWLPGNASALLPLPLNPLWCTCQPPAVFCPLYFWSLEKYTWVLWIFVALSKSHLCSW